MLIAKMSLPRSIFPMFPWLVLIAVDHSPAAAQGNILPGEQNGQSEAWAVYNPAGFQPGTSETGSAVRPGLMEQIRAVTQGRMLLEGGYAFLYDKSNGTRVSQHVVPDMLLRFGLTDRLEVRLGWPGYIETNFDQPLGSTRSGNTLGPNVGFMLDLWPQRGMVPQTAVLASVPMTLEGNPFVLEGLQPLSQLLYLWNLTDRLAMGGTTGAALFDSAGDSFFQFQQTVSIDYLLADRWGAFGEWEMLVDHGSANDGSQHVLSGGFSHLLTERLQVNWRAGLGVNRRAPDFLTDLRFSFRF